MASASSVVLTGKVKRTKIARDGTAVVVKKTLGDGTTLEERFPKRRMKGKRKDTTQMIPVEDVIRGMEAYAETIEPEVQRRAEAVNVYANKLLGEEMAKASKQISKEKARVRFQKGRVAAQKKAAKDARQVYDAGQNRTQRLRVGAVDDSLPLAALAQPSFAEYVTTRLNAELGL
jgi:hypothetical protein